MADATLIPRRAARVILLDAFDRVLLLHGNDPAEPDHTYWFTVGGGLDPGESMLDAAVRELFEETGLRLPSEAFTGPVWHESTRFPFDGLWYAQEQDFFVVRVTSWDVDWSGLSDYERTSFDASRWWTIEELEHTGEPFYPVELPTLLRTVTGVG